MIDMFIYCNSESTKNILLKAGFKLLPVTATKNEETVWIFENDETIAIPDFTDVKNDIFMSNKMSF